MEGIPYVPYPAPVAPVASVDGFGGGMGALVMAALLGGNGFGNRGFVGNGVGTGVVDGGIVTPAFLAASLANVQNSNAQDEILAGQGDIKEAVQAAASATQISQALQFNALGIATAKGFGEAMTQGALNSAALGVQVQKTAGELGVQVALNTAAVGTAVERTGAANAIAFKDAAIQTAATQYALATAIKQDGDLTRAKIDEYNLANLNRQLTVADIALSEERGFRRSRETEINITNTNTAIAAQYGGGCLHL